MCLITCLCYFCREISTDYLYTTSLTEETLKRSEPDVRMKSYDSLTEHGKPRRLAYDIHVMEKKLGRNSDQLLLSCVRNTVKCKSPESELFKKIDDEYKKFIIDMCIHGVTVWGSYQMVSSWYARDFFPDECLDNKTLFRKMISNLTQMGCLKSASIFETFVNATVKHFIDIVYLTVIADRNDFQKFISNQCKLVKQWPNDVKENVIIFWKNYLPNSFGSETAAHEILKSIQRDTNKQNQILKQLPIDKDLNKLVLNYQKKLIQQKPNQITRRPTVEYVSEVFITLLKKLEKYNLKHTEMNQDKVHEVHGHIAHYASKRTWKLYLSGNRVVELTSTDNVDVAYKGLCHLTDLFYGIRCLLAHGSQQDKFESGVMSDTHSPKGPEDFGIILVKGNEVSQDECSQHLLNIWNDAVKNRTLMNVDLNLFQSELSFYLYMAEIILQVGTYITCDLTVEHKD